MRRCASLTWVLGMVAAWVAALPAAHAQGFPSRPIRIVVAFAPGGGADTNARIVAPRLNEQMGVPVLVDNRPGAGSIVGTELVANAAPDGYTLLLGSSEFAVNPALVPKLPYDTLKQFTPIAQTVSSQYVLSTHPSIPVSTVKGFLALAKARPGELNYGSGGVGSASHLAAELLQSMTGTRLLHVPFKGTGPATIALLGGELGFMFSSTTAAVAHIQSGKLRALAVTGPKRFDRLPDVPTMAQAGVDGYVVTGWFGLIAPAGTPRPVVQRLNEEVAKALRHPAARERFAALGTEPVESTPEAFAAFLRGEMDKWTRVVKAAGVRPE